MSDNLTSKRGCIVIGINQYNKPKIPDLKGAENDANEIAKILQQYGKFASNKDCHILLGPNATSENIRTAINDLFWSEDPCDIILFYFSGHGIVDGYGNGYLAPYDIEHDKPFIKGINMKEINGIIGSFVDSAPGSNRGVCMLLDCCHSGISTDRDRGGPAVDFVQNAQSGVNGQGRVILVSSDASEISREKGDCTHDSTYPPHYHGIFSSFLIDGLLGRASENGLITFNALRDFVEKRMQDSNQRLKFNGQGDSKILNLQLAIEPKKHKEYVQQKIQEAKKFNKKDVDSILDTSKLVNELLGYELCQDEANILKNSITNVLEDYNNKILEWIAKNRSCFRSRIDDIDSTLYTTINSLDRYLSSFDMFIGIKPFELCLLYTLCDIINNSEKIDDSADNFEIQQVNSFIQRCQTCFNVFGKESKKEAASGGYKSIITKTSVGIKKTSDNYRSINLA